MMGYLSTILDERVTVRKGFTGAPVIERQRADRRVIRTAGPHDFSCVMLPLYPTADAPEWDTLRKVDEAFRSFHVDSADVVEREVQPHITALFGVTTDDVERVRDALRGVSPGSVWLGKTAVFPADEKRPESDVVVVEVKSEWLLRLHDALCAGLPYEVGRPFRPHTTLCYVKPGTGVKYADKTVWDAGEVWVERVEFSDRRGESTDIALRWGAAFRMGAPRHRDFNEDQHPRAEDGKWTSGGNDEQDGLPGHTQYDAEGNPVDAADSAGFAQDAEMRVTDGDRSTFKKYQKAYENEERQGFLQAVRRYDVDHPTALSGMDAVKQYVSEDYSSINGCLRTNDCPGPTQRVVKAIAGVVNVAPPLAKETTLYRFQGRVTDLTVGETFQTKGFLSTSSVPIGAFAIGGARVAYEIKAPKGSKGVLRGFNKDEVEYLFKHDAKFRVVGVKDLPYGVPNGSGKALKVKTYQLEYLG